MCILNFPKTPHILTDICGMSKTRKSLYKVYGARGCIFPVLPIFGREMAYLCDTICAKFDSNDLTGA